MRGHSSGAFNNLYCVTLEGVIEKDLTGIRGEGDGNPFNKPYHPKEKGKKKGPSPSYEGEGPFNMQVSS